MKIAMFGFSRDKNGNYNPSDDFLPMNYTRDFVAYVGTHDNDTTRGWFDSLNEDDTLMLLGKLSFSMNNIGFDGKLYTFPYFCTFLLRDWIKICSIVIYTLLLYKKVHELQINRRESPRVLAVR